MTYCRILQLCDFCYQILLISRNPPVRLIHIYLYCSLGIEKYKSNFLSLWNVEESLLTDTTSIFRCMLKSSLKTSKVRLIVKTNDWCAKILKPQQNQFSQMWLLYIEQKTSNTETYRHLTVSVTIHKARFPSNRLLHGDGEQILPWPEVSQVRKRRVGEGKKEGVGWKKQDKLASRKLGTSWR